jgi:hypothetical protein
MPPNPQANKSNGIAPVRFAAIGSALGKRPKTVICAVTKKQMRPAFLTKPTKGQWVNER